MSARFSDYDAECQWADDFVSEHGVSEAQRLLKSYPVLPYAAPFTGAQLLEIYAYLDSVLGVQK